MTKFDIIYADPPWHYKVWSAKGTGRSAEQHYSVLSHQEIVTLPMKNLAADNSVLLLWAIWPNLVQALQVGQAWGFEYKTCVFLWAKTNKRESSTFFLGLGYYTRANTEPCLLFTRGKPLPRYSRSVRQLVVEPIKTHSEKPKLHNQITELFGSETSRLELFGRVLVPGWTVLGNEINGKDIREELNGLQ
jgi:N6-adenosine-specific RNA methylase IME4